MSSAPHVQRCREWIQEQIEALATLRTANTRDQSFRNWRQNTVTAIQRIWPEDRERVERFRRIAFTPPQSRTDARATREWFGKGIGESRAYLNMLLEVIEREGVPAPAEAGREAGAASLADDVAFPMIDLNERPAAAAPAASAAAAAPATDGLDVTSGYATPDGHGAQPRDPASPAPPALRVDWSAAAPGEAPSGDAPAAEAPPALGEGDAPAAPADDRPSVEIPLAPALSAAAAAGAPAGDSPAPDTSVRETAGASAHAADAGPAPVTESTPTREMPLRETPSQARQESPSRVIARLRTRSKAKKPGPKGKLKDMLGLAEFESRMATPAPEATAPAAAPEPVAVPARETPAPPPAAPEVSAPAAREPVPAAEATGPAELAAAATDASGPPAPPAPGDEAPRVEAGPPEVTPDEADRERATLDFLRTSPVLGLVGKPVHRRSEAGGHSDPDAVAVEALAGELARLGVPDGMKTSLAARLQDVAKHLEAGDLDWPLLRGTVTDAMQYPLLARRLMPVLLPWFERAA